MRKRNIQFLIRLNKKESQDLEKKVKKSGLSRSKYLRSLISGNSPKEQPTQEYFAFMESIQNLRDETERLCELFYTSQGVKVERLEIMIDELDILKLQLMQAFLLPDKAV